jgi:hypothetical protein
MIKTPSSTTGKITISSLFAEKEMQIADKLEMEIIKKCKNRY